MNDMGGTRAILRKIDRTILASWILWALLALGAPGEVRGRWVWVIAGVVIVVIAARLDTWLGQTDERRGVVARVIFTSLAIVTAFTALGFVIPGARSRTYETELIAIDRWLFGVDPTVWFERLAHPALTELLQLVYSTFYFLPFLLGAILWRSGQWREMAIVLLAVTLGFYLSYVGYVLVPARSPVYPIHGGESLPGLWVAESVWHTLSRLEANKLDAFPSGHTEIMVILMVYAWRLSRRQAFPIFAVIGSLMIFSTIYLRYHYVIDVIAGAALAFAVLWLTDRWVARSPSISRRA